MYRLYNYDATEFSPDLIYEYMYKYCVDNCIKFRVEYVGVPSKGWAKLRTRYNEKIKSIIVIDKKDAFMIKLCSDGKVIVKDMIVGN